MRERDVACVAAQLGRRPQALNRVVARCPWGCVAAVEDLPYTAQGRPFPTLFYATCPTLVASVGALESAGGVKRFAAELAADAELQRALAVALGYQRRRRRALVAQRHLTMLDHGASLHTGIGGVARPHAVKCLHAHAAFALARPGYLLGERVLHAAAAGAPLWCSDRRCVAFCTPPEAASTAPQASATPSAATA